MHCRRLFLLSLLFCLSVQVAVIQAAPVALPIALDYPLLRRLLLLQLFNGPGQSAELLNDPSGCSRILVTDPRLAVRGNDLEILTTVEARVGAELLGRCNPLLQWSGGARFQGRPVIGGEGTTVILEPVAIRLLDTQGDTVASERIQQLLQQWIPNLYGRFRLDLAPSIGQLGRLLSEMLPHHSAEQLQAMLDSFRLDHIRVTPSGLDLQLGFDIAQPEQPLSGPLETALTDQELQALEHRWQMMEALITFAVKFYASRTDLAELREGLLEILLDSRYRLRDALTLPGSDHEDPVRRWFLDSWSRLQPMIRRIALEQPGQEQLLWITLLSATDALTALDRLGPAFGLEISSAGLRRLARMINESGDIDPLFYDLSPDPQLRQLFLSPEPIEPERPSGMRFDFSPLRPAWAGSPHSRLERWVPTRDQLDSYLPLVASLLKESAETTLKQSDERVPKVAELFTRLTLATAWQESCWRQYQIEKGKVEPLRSGSGDVGLMQMNEKVWRGFYDLHKLRWDIAYNSRAGAEVLHQYLVRYAWKQAEHKRAGGFDNLARASYSAYNGGPGQVARYRTTGVDPHWKKVDAAFWDKYRQVKAGQDLNVARCLGGTAAVKQTSAAPLTNEKVVAGKSVSPPANKAAPRAAGKNWVLAQNQSHFTLQLGVFSTRDNAQKFISEHKLQKQARIIPLPEARPTRFVILLGSHAQRGDAERARDRLKRLRPWIRSFGEIAQQVRS